VIQGEKMLGQIKVVEQPVAHCRSSITCKYELLFRWSEVSAGGFSEQLFTQIVGRLERSFLYLKPLRTISK
jgi:EAL domain-containing protein (putative c-di-GMP-specific phosphodiesterase class I)